MGWHKVPEFESVSSSDDNPFASSRVQPTGKVSVKLPVDDWLCKKIEKLNLTTTEGYPTRNSETAGLLKDQFVKPPRLSRWYGCMLRRETVTILLYLPGLRNRPRLTVLLARLPDVPFLLPHPPGHSTRTCLGVGREQPENKLSCATRLLDFHIFCLTRVQDAMSSQLKSLHLDSSKGKSSERMRQAVDELDYLVTFNWSISQAMARTMQDLSEGVFISMANFTLARRDSCLEYLHAGVKQDTLTALRTAPVHLHSLFPDQLITKAEEEICRSEERCSSGQPHRRRGRFHPYAPSDRSANQPDRKSSNPAWKQIRDR